MPKTSKLERKAAAIAAKDKDTTSGAASTTTLSRGQRKRQAKRQQYLQREKLVMSSLLLKKQDEQKKRIDGLDALRQALTVVDTSKQEPKKQPTKSTRVETNHAKKEVTAREVNHMNLVMEHPAFQENPFGTIQEHLKNTLQDQREELALQSQERAKKEKEEQAAKKEKRKERQGMKHRKKFRATRRR